jgi:hypothetical protein
VQAVTRKTRILDVVYNASNNELVRTSEEKDIRSLEGLLVLAVGFCTLPARCLWRPRQTEGYQIP